MKKKFILALFFLIVMLQGCAKNSNFWKALGQGLSNYSQQQEQERQQRYETMQRSLTVIDSNPAYRLDKNSGYIYRTNGNVHVLK